MASDGVDCPLFSQSPRPDHLVDNMCDTFRFLQVDINWWAMVYERQNSTLRTGLQSVIAVRLDSATVHRAG